MATEARRIGYAGDSELWLVAELSLAFQILLRHDRQIDLSSSVPADLYPPDFCLVATCGCRKNSIFPHGNLRKAKNALGVCSRFKRCRPTTLLQFDRNVTQTVSLRVLNRACHRTW